MIVREFARDPLGLIGTFDFFNDYDDTRRWLSASSIYGRREMLQLLDAGWSLWIQRRLRGAPDKRT